MQRNARFWAYLNGGLVKITLRPGQSLSWNNSRQTEEGWNTEFDSWEHIGDRIIRDCGSMGRDCDGRIEYYSTSECMLTDLACGCEPYGIDDCADVRYPAWELTDDHCRDYAAEAAGY